MQRGNNERKEQINSATSTNNCPTQNNAQNQYVTIFNNSKLTTEYNKKLSYRTGTARQGGSVLVQQKMHFMYKIYF